MADTTDDALRAVIKRRMDEAGLNPPRLAARAGAQEGRIYKALDGTRGITPGTLKVIADGLGTTVTSLKMEAGALSRDELALMGRRVPFADYISGDPLLTDEARETLIRVYEGLTGSSARRHGRQR